MKTGRIDIQFIRPSKLPVFRISLIRITPSYQRTFELTIEKLFHSISSITSCMVEL